MCEPTTIASLAVMAISTAASMYAQKEQADAQADYQEEQSAEYARVTKINQENANREFVESSTAERIKQMQNQDAASQEMQALQRERLEKQGQALASSETSGMALDSLMTDFMRSEAQKKDVIKQQLDMAGVSADTAISGYGDRRKSRMNSQGSYITSPVNGPNYLAGALQIGAAGLGAYDTWKEGQPADIPTGMTAATKEDSSIYGNSGFRR